MVSSPAVDTGGGVADRVVGVGQAADVDRVGPDVDAVTDVVEAIAGVPRSARVSPEASVLPAVSAMLKAGVELPYTRVTSLALIVTGRGVMVKFTVVADRLSE